MQLLQRCLRKPETEGQEEAEQQKLCFRLVSALEQQRHFDILTETIIKSCHGPFGKECWGTLLGLRRAAHSQRAMITEGSRTLDGVAVLSFADVLCASGSSINSLCFLVCSCTGSGDLFRGVRSIPQSSLGRDRNIQLIPGCTFIATCTKALSRGC